MRFVSNDNMMMAMMRMCSMCMFRRAHNRSADFLND